MKKRFGVLIRLGAALAVTTTLVSPTIVAAFTPSVTSYTTTSSYVSGLVAGPDGNMWYSSRAGGKVGKVTLGGTVTEYATPSSSDTPSITTGPDGNLWFVEYSNNKVGKVTTSGSFTEYTIPTSSSSPYRIVAGPDGNMWYLGTDSNKIGKVTTSGSFTEYTIPTSSSNPQGLAVGPDNNLWFTETTPGKIGKITTSGTITEYSLTSGINPTAIAAGPDGNLWFGTNGDNKVGKITTAGTSTLYSVSASVEGIGVGPDNLVWFSLMSGANNIGSITADGTVTEYPLTGDPYSFAVVLRPDNNLWVPDYASTGKVVKVAFPPKPGLPATKNVTVEAGKSLRIDVLAGISGNPDPATLSIVNGPSHGTAVLGSITYTPTAGYTGTDSLTYQVCSTDYNKMCSQTVLGISVVGTLADTGQSWLPSLWASVSLVAITTFLYIKSRRSAA